MDIHAYWKACLEQDKNKMREFFCENAYINWHNTNEQFTLEEFIIANCEYPGLWNGEVKRIEKIGDLIITVTLVYSEENKNNSFHVTSFIKIKNDKIKQIDEYWGNDGNPPQWRIDKNIGKNIK